MPQCVRSVARVRGSSSLSPLRHLAAHLRRSSAQASTSRQTSERRDTPLPWQPPHTAGTSHAAATHKTAQRTLAQVTVRAAAVQRYSARSKTHRATSAQHKKGKATEKKRKHRSTLKLRVVRLRWSAAKAAVPSFREERVKERGTHQASAHFCACARHACSALAPAPRSAAPAHSLGSTGTLRNAQ